MNVEVDDGGTIAGLRAKFDEVVGWLKDTFGGIWEGIQRGIIDSINLDAIWRNITAFFNDLLDIGRSALAALKKILKSWADYVGELIAQILSIGGKCIEILTGAIARNLAKGFAAAIVARWGLLLRGDMNGDGFADSTDARLILEREVGLT